MNLPYLAHPLTISFCFSAIAALAADHDPIFGRWRDSAPPNFDPIPFLDISEDKIILDQMVIYQTVLVKRSENSLLFKVTGMNRSEDPEGCAPSHKVSYIMAELLPPMLIDGTEWEWVRLAFYAGDKEPIADSIDDINDIGLCTIHPFLRR
jgi:hypothetical protein